MNQSCSRCPAPQPLQRQIRATSATYTTAHGNARSLIHRARPGIEPTSSVMLLRFVSAEPERNSLTLLFFFWSFCLLFLGPHLRYMEVPRLAGPIGAVASGLRQTTLDPIHVCNLYHSSRQCWILNPLSKARDQTHNLTVPSLIYFCYATTGTPTIYILNVKLQ